MILVDTSVWVSHLRRHNPRLDNLLGFELIFCHPLIVGEIACGGGMKDRSLVLALLEELPKASVATYEEVLGFIEQHRLMGQGLGFIDVHLLASCRMTGLTIWTEDKPLQRAAQQLQLLYH